VRQIQPHAVDDIDEPPPSRRRSSTNETTTGPLAPRITGAPTPTETGVISMIRQAPMTTTDSDVEDRSMRVVEYVMAIIAVVAAGVLAFIR